MGEIEVPPPDIIESLDWEGLKYVTVKVALELDIFNIIAEGHNTLDDITRRAKTSLRGMDILLNALCPLGFLSKTDNYYHLTTVSDTYLVKGKPSYSAPVYLAWWQSRERLLACVREGVTDLNVAAEDKQDFWGMYATQDLVKWPQIAQDSQNVWDSIGFKEDKLHNLRVLDVGSGTGVKSFVLAQSDPSVRVTLSDFPKILEVSRQAAEKMGARKQVSYLSGGWF